MKTIKELLDRRTDLSTFLVHLTRDYDGTARENLLSIAASTTIKARSPLGPAAAHELHLADTSATQKVVCFTETPLEHTWMMLQEIQGRSVQLRPYGLAITKSTARKDHFNPVWYSDISTRGGRDWPVTAVNTMVNDAVGRATGPNGQVDALALSNEPIFKITPFFEQMGPQSDGRPKEFWWEREWRRIGDYRVRFPSRIVAIFAPADDHQAFRSQLAEQNKDWSERPLMDPYWGLERMIATLANIPEEHIGPFPSAP